MDLTTVHQGVQKRKRRKRVGRGTGSGMGKTATRGHKGMYATTGAKKPKFTFEGGQMQLFRRMPKRGFSHATWDKTYHIVNLDQLEAKFNDGDTVDPDALARARLTRGPADGVRILGRGELTKKLDVKAHHFTRSAAEKIASRGGSTEVLPGRNKPARNKMKAKTGQGS
jgi:large subunit ribosomal protein L15